MTEPAERPPHRVLLRAPARFEPAPIAALLAARTGLPPESLLLVVRRDWGALTAPGSAEGAESLAKALEAAGHPAAAVPASLVEEPPPAEDVTRAELSGDGFDVVAGRAAPGRLLWSKLAVLAAGAVSSRETKTVTEGPSAGARAARVALTMATGLPLGAGKAKTRQVSEEKRFTFVELVFAEPARRLRLSGGDFDYGTALGAKMGYSAELNFRALVAELASRAPGALRSRGARAILAKEPSARHDYESFDDAAAEERWLSALAALKLAL